MTSDEIIRVMERAAELGVTELQFKGVKLKMAYKSEVQKPKVMADDATELSDKELAELFKPAIEEMTPEEILYYATPHFDELQAQKQVRLEQSELAKELKD